MNHVFSLDLVSISHNVSISCYENSKIRILLIFSCVNDLRKNTNKNNIKWFTRSYSKSLSCSSDFTKKTCVLTDICCVLLVFIFPNLVWCWCNIIKQIFHAFFYLISKLYTIDNIQLRFAQLNINYLGWIISDNKQKSMEYLLIITITTIIKTIMIITTITIIITIIIIKQYTWKIIYQK